MNNNEEAANPEGEYHARLEKLKQLKEDGVAPYLSRFDKKLSSSDIKDYAKENKLREADDVFSGPKDIVSTAGRIVSSREHGKIIFFNIQDTKGEIQICLKYDIVGSKAFDFFLDYIDLGDFVGVIGEPFLTKQGKLAVAAKEVKLLSKTLRPIPGQYYGVEDVELKYRKRYLDMIANKETLKRFLLRSRIVEEFRQWLLENDFVELTTRILQPQAGGAIAETFTTHHNALDKDFHLRIAPELDLKMAIAGGFERVFEFAVNFRNEGIDPSHLQEFTMLEWYAAYEDFETGMRWTEEMIRRVVKKTLNTLKFSVFDKDGLEHTIDLSKPFPRRTFREAMKEVGVDTQASHEELIEVAVKAGLDKKEVKKRGRGNLLDDIYKKLVRTKLIGPMFLTHHPKDLVPLARLSDKGDDTVESYQLIIGGWEVVKAYSELVDPILQREAFEKQAQAKAKGDKEAMDVNEEFLTAMEYGMPPMTGWGMGIDRFVALVTGQKNLRDVVLFPLMKPESK